MKGLEFLKSINAPENDDPELKAKLNEHKPRRQMTQGEMRMMEMMRKYNKNFKGPAATLFASPKRSTSPVKPMTPQINENTRQALRQTAKPKFSQTALKKNWAMVIKPGPNASAKWKNSGAKVFNMAKKASNTSKAHEEIRAYIKKRAESQKKLMLKHARATEKLMLKLQKL
jgi:hypothetical protein